MPRTQQQREALGRELVALRLEAGYATISELAASDVGVSSKTIGNAEAGRVVSEGSIQRIRAFLTAQRREQAEATRVGAPYTLDGDRYLDGVRLLDEWMSAGEDAQMHPPTESLWLWSPSQLAENLNEQVAVLESNFSNGLMQEMRELGERAFTRVYGTEEENAHDDTAPTKEAGQAGIPLERNELGARRRVVKRRLSAPAPSVSDDGAESPLHLDAVAMDDHDLLAEREAQQEGA